MDVVLLGWHARGNGLGAGPLGRGNVHLAWWLPDGTPAHLSVLHPDVTWVHFCWQFAAGPGGGWEVRVEPRVRRLKDLGLYS